MNICRLSKQVYFMYKIIPVLATLLFFVSTGVDAQLFPVSSIPDSLRENAHCIIREYTKVIEMNSANSGRERIRKVMTILDKEGESMAQLAIGYDQNSSVSINLVAIYDETGKRIRKIKPSETEDSPASGSSELFSDDRVKHFRPVYAAYPYSVEYDYETSMTNMISLGCWRPVGDYNVSLEHASLTVTYPASSVINRKEINIGPAKRDQTKDLITELWEVHQTMAFEEEPFDPVLSERVPNVYLMPADLIFGRYRGTANTWQEYGTWIHTLWDGRDQLTAAEQLKVEAHLKDIPDTLARIKALYAYLQEHTRYVAIMLGIGGYQPFGAMTVAETGYGDCKALVNYMHSLLKAAGIPSIPALVAAGRYQVEIFPEFPNFHQFNHVILCVPFRHDTIWLECTSQRMPFGYLGDFTDNRQVLLITEKGGQFSRTPEYGASDNRRICRTVFSVDSTGSVSGTLNTRYLGLQYDDVVDLLWSNSAEQKKWLYKNTSLPSVQITGFSAVNKKETMPEAVVSEVLVSKNYCSFSGNYMILPLNLVDVQEPVQKMLKTRYSDVLINRSTVEIDTLLYKIPENFHWESVPGEKTIHSVFGDYTCTVKADNHEILFIRRFSINQGRYKPAAYKELYDFILSVSKADNVKMILAR
jgi:hypothetical protein